MAPSLGAFAPWRFIFERESIVGIAPLGFRIMALTVAIQMDPIERIDISGDSTFALALEAQARGHDLLYYGPRDLSLRDGAVTAAVRPLHVRNEQNNHYTLGSASVCNLAESHVVLMRQDPPFDMAYITATHLLERLAGKSL